MKKGLFVPALSPANQHVSTCYSLLSSTYSWHKLQIHFCIFRQLWKSGLGTVSTCHLRYYFLHVELKVSLFTFQIADKYVTFQTFNASWDRWSIIIWTLRSRKRGPQCRLINLKPWTSASEILNNHNPWLIQNLRAQDWQWVDCTRTEMLQ